METNTDPKVFVIAAEDNGKTTYWQEGLFWGNHLPDAGKFTLKEARNHEMKFISGGVWKVFVVDTRTMTVMTSPPPGVNPPTDLGYTGTMETTKKLFLLARDGLGLALN